MNTISTPRLVARIAAGVGAVAGVGYYIRNRGTSATRVPSMSEIEGKAKSSMGEVERKAKAALGTKDDTGIADTVKGAYGGKTGGNTSLGQRSAD